LRSRAFDAVARFSTENGESLSADAIRGMWQEMASLAKTTEEQIKVISALIQHDADWSVKLLEQYRDSENDRAADLADRGLREMEEQRKLRDQDDGE
jgi:hypothetical protein